MILFTIHSSHSLDTSMCCIHTYNQYKLLFHGNARSEENDCFIPPLNDYSNKQATTTLYTNKNMRLEVDKKGQIAFNSSHFQMAKGTRPMRHATAKYTTSIVLWSRFVIENGNSRFD